MKSRSETLCMKQICLLLVALGVLLAGCSRQETVPKLQATPRPRFELIERSGSRESPPKCDLYLMKEDGQIKRISQGHTYRKGLLVTNSLAIWQEWEVAGQGAFEQIWASKVMAADFSGFITDISGWICSRAAKDLPTADPDSVRAYVSPQDDFNRKPRPAGMPIAEDPRRGVVNFWPQSVELKADRPAVTIWCVVARKGSYIPLALHINPDDILAELAEANGKKNRTATIGTNSPSSGRE